MSTGYGVDVSLTDKLVSGRLVSGKAVVVEAFFRRLTTARGSLGSSVFPEDLMFGFDVAGLVGSVGYARAAEVAAGMAENELSKDDRAYDVRCGALLTTQADGAQAILLEVSATLVDSDEDFALTLSITEAAATLVSA